jgi:hypothetical protein
MIHSHSSASGREVCLHYVRRPVGCLQCWADTCHSVEQNCANGSRVGLSIVRHLKLLQCAMRLQQRCFLLLSRMNSQPAYWLPPACICCEDRHKLGPSCRTGTSSPSSVGHSPRSPPTVLTHMGTKIDPPLYLSHSSSCHQYLLRCQLGHTA